MKKTEGHQFYNKVARKFGNYHSGARYTSEYETQNPEAVFKEKLLSFSGKDKTVLDVGCADGRFTLSIAPHFSKIVAIDLSEGMLKAAKGLQKEKGVENVSFEKQDAGHTTYLDESFDIVYSRRGPSSFREIYRLLKPGGFFVEIEIGEEDCRKLKEVFGRGQDFGDWEEESHLERDIKRSKKVGLKPIFTQDYLYNEYYPTYKDLDLFLQGVPIFEDFDSEKDRKFLGKYVGQFKEKKGIRLKRHRLVTVSCKKPR